MPLVTGCVPIPLVTPKCSSTCSAEVMIKWRLQELSSVFWELLAGLNRGARGAVGGAGPSEQALGDRWGGEKEELGLAGEEGWSVPRWPDALPTLVSKSAQRGHLAPMSHELTSTLLVPCVLGLLILVPTECQFCLMDMGIPSIPYVPL